MAAAGGRGGQGSGRAWGGVANNSGHHLGRGALAPEATHCLPALPYGPAPGLGGGLGAGARSGWAPRPPSSPSCAPFIASSAVLSLISPMGMVRVAPPARTRMAPRWATRMVRPVEIATRWGRASPLHCIATTMSPLSRGGKQGEVKGLHWGARRGFHVEAGSHSRISHSPGGSKGSGPLLCSRRNEFTLANSQSSVALCKDGHLGGRPPGHEAHPAVRGLVKGEAAQRGLRLLLDARLVGVAPAPRTPRPLACGGGALGECGPQSGGPCCPPAASRQAAALGGVALSRPGGGPLPPPTPFPPPSSPPRPAAAAAHPPPPRPAAPRRTPRPRYFHPGTPSPRPAAPPAPRPAAL